MTIANLTPLAEAMGRISIDLGTKLVSVANQRMHWGTKARLAKKHRQSAYYQCCAALGGKPAPMPCTVTIIRIAPQHRRLDSDNLASACKATRDGIADALGVDDADPRVRWAYDQRAGGKNEYGCEVVIQPRAEGRT